MIDQYLQIEMDVLASVFFEEGNFYECKGLQPQHFSVELHAETWRELQKGYSDEIGLSERNQFLADNFSELIGVRKRAEKILTAEQLAEYSGVLIRRARTKELAATVLDAVSQHGSTSQYDELVGKITAAMGDFETSDHFSFSYAIDASPIQILFASSVDDHASQSSSSATGSQYLLNDPLSINGQVLNNQFQQLSQSLIGSGSILSL